MRGLSNVRFMKSNDRFGTSRPPRSGPGCVKTASPAHGVETDAPPQEVKWVRRLPTQCRYTNRGGLVRPAFDLYTTAGSPILEHEIKSMQAYDRSHQAQPQSRSRGLPAPISAIEPTQHLGEIGRRDTRPAVG